MSGRLHLPVFAEALSLPELETNADDCDAVFMEPRAHFDRAILGLLDSPSVVVYSAPKVLEALMREQDMSYEDAREWFDFNIAGSKGEGFPLYLWPTELASGALTPAD
jgi:hypothetical protein